MKPRGPPPDPFVDVDAALVRRVAEGELEADKALEIAAGVRWLAFMRRVHGLGRARERLEREALKVLEDLNRTKEAEIVAIDACIFYARAYGNYRHERIAKEARLDWESERSGPGAVGPRPMPGDDDPPF